MSVATSGAVPLLSRLHGSVLFPRPALIRLIASKRAGALGNPSPKHTQAVHWFHAKAEETIGLGHTKLPKLVVVLYLVELGNGGVAINSAAVKLGQRSRRTRHPLIRHCGCGIFKNPCEHVQPRATPEYKRPDAMLRAFPVYRRCLPILRLEACLRSGFGELRRGVLATALTKLVSPLMTRS